MKKRNQVRSKSNPVAAGPQTKTKQSVSVQTLVDFAARKVQDCPIDEQIPVWQALSETLPNKDACEHARRIARLQSEVSARQLQSSDLIPCPSETGPGCLRIFDRVADDVVADVPLSEEEYSAMIVESNRRGLLPQQFIADAVREMIARTPGASPADAKASKFTHLVIDLEHYADKSRYLTSSLLDSLEYWREHGEPSEDCFGSLLCGCSLIVEDLNDSLSQIITGLLQNIPKRIDDQVTGQGTSPSAA